MRSEREAEMALECLRISQGCIRHAEQMLAFVTGKAVDDVEAKRATDAQRTAAHRAPRGL